MSNTSAQKSYGDMLGDRLTEIALRLGHEIEGAHGKARQHVVQYADSRVRICHDHVFGDGVRLSVYQNMYHDQKDREDQGWVIVYNKMYGNVRICPRDPSTLARDQMTAWQREHGDWIEYLSTIETRLH